MKSLTRNSRNRKHRSPSTRRVWIEISMIKSDLLAGLSPSTRRVWIEILSQYASNISSTCHPPHGGCGLKWLCSIKNTIFIPGHPPHGGCGLKSLCLALPTVSTCHPPHGGCGLKFFPQAPTLFCFGGHPPHGGCGLKLLWVKTRLNTDLRHPPHGGCGLKFHVLKRRFCRNHLSPSTRRVWIEIVSWNAFYNCSSSPSTRRVWIEINA